MKKNLLFLAGLLFSFNAFAQSPGGVSSNIKLWLRGDKGITVNATNGVTLWNDLSGAGVTGNFSPTNGLSGQQPPTYQQAGINFNQQLAFVAANNTSLVSLNAFPGNNIFDPANNTVLEVMKLHTMTSTGVWLKWQFNNTTSQRFGNEYNTSNPGQIRFDFPGGDNPNFYSASNVFNLYKLVTLGTQSFKTIRLNGKLDATFATATNAFNPGTTPGRFSIGNEYTGDSYPTTIDIAEVIVFNKTLTVAERNKVESYLAIKYGFTLDQVAANNNDYTSANGTVIWSRAANIPFGNNITGIGRDDADSLMQRQSMSINAPVGMVTIYKGNYKGGNTPVTNIANPNNIAPDNSFVVFGDNNLGLTSTRCFAGTGTNGTSSLRLARVWKAQTTGTVGVVTLAINASDVPASTRNLLVSTDSAFTSANTTVYRLDNTSGILTASMTLPGPTAYFTYGGDSLTAKPTANSPLCEGSTLQLSSNLAGGTYSWSGPSGFTSTSANPTINGVTIANSGYYVLNGSVSGCPIRSDSVSVIVSIKPPPPTVTTPLIYCAGDAAPPLTAGFIPGNTLHWYMNPVGGNGTTTPPVPNTAYEDTLTYWVTQDNNGCESIRTKQEIQIRYKPNGIILGTQSSICQGVIDTFNYYGNPRSNAIYDFKTTPFATTVLSGSGPGPYIVRFDSAGTYRVRMQVNNYGCVGPETFFDVTVRPSPAAYATSKEDACVDEIVNVALYSTASNVTSYNYTFDNGRVLYGAGTGGPYGISWSSPGLKVIQLVATTIGCPSRVTYDSITVHDYPDARIAGVSSNNICAGDSILLRASETDSAAHFVWKPDNFFSSGNIYEAWGVVKKTGYVMLTVTSRYGCVASDSALITTQPCCEVYFPNAFTPNGDGKNDFFRPVTKGHHEIASFRIVNRWGQVVFESKDERHGWDGIYNGREQDAGAYYYYIKYMCREKDWIEEKGEFLLLR